MNLFRGWMADPHSVFSAWKESDGTWSWARLSASATVTTAIWGFIHVVLHNHAIPDAVTLGGLATFGAFPYALNKVSTAFAKDNAKL